MSILVQQRLDALINQGDPKSMFATKIGLEKESLRVSETGGMAKTPHPIALGSALTHPWITTDYSEALCEFITPPVADAKSALDYLADVQSFVYSKLDKEILWATSMPCVLSGDENISVAQYGSSNAGQMKHIYRLGLGHRYGRVMQVIAGVHFNWSMADSFWPSYQKVCGSNDTPRAFKDDVYMGLVRNLQRNGWLIPYLFGASPAVCKSFFPNHQSRLPAFDESTFYEPYATSLRMGDIGYQNSKEEGLGIKACYDNLQSYADSLLRATNTEVDLWKNLGVKDGDEYRQLNANILQIENEYYATVRPKQILQGIEKPSLALKRRGIEYVELRSLDVNAYHPLGVDETQIHFLEAFLLHCLLSDSPVVDARERSEIDRNIEMVAHQGRDPGFRLLRDGLQVSLRDWSTEFLSEMMAVCEFLDTHKGVNHYKAALDQQLAKALDPTLTPSARMLDEMRENGEGFYHFAQRLSHQHVRYFNERKLDDETCSKFEQLAQDSISQQVEIEAKDEVSFEQFLKDYMAQA